MYREKLWKLIKDELLFVTDREICYFLFNAFLLGPGRIFKIWGALSLIFLLIPDRFQLCKTIITDDFTPALLKDHKKFVPASSKIQNSSHYCFQRIKICLAWRFELACMAGVRKGRDLRRETVHEGGGRRGMPLRKPLFSPSRLLI